MLLTISTSHQPATDLGFLLHKHPDRVQSFELSFGRAHVFYPEASEEKCSASLLLDVDPVGMVRNRSRTQDFLLGQYVNDRPYVASSFLSVAIAQVFGSALGGRCKQKPDLVNRPIPLSARIDVLPVRGGEDALRRLFEPLGYTVHSVPHSLDTQFPEWGSSPYYSVTIEGTKSVSDLLTHLYVLIPVFDNEKHYFVGEPELEKLLAKGDGWLSGHPEKELISRRYLRNRRSLLRNALARLSEAQSDEERDDDEKDDGSANETNRPHDEPQLEQTISLNEQRHTAVLETIKASGARTVLDLGCGEGKLLRELFKVKQFESIVGLDVSIRSLEYAHKKLKLERMPERQRQRIELIHGSLIYRDKRLEGFDAAALVEVIEHLDPPRLTSLERVVFEFARPTTVVVTTPNQEYNSLWESLPAGQLRHVDHRFEWTRQEFQTWAKRMCEQFGYQVRFHPIGTEHAEHGSPTQMGVFERT